MEAARVDKATLRFNLVAGTHPIGMWEPLLATDAFKED